MNPPRSNAPARRLDQVLADAAEHFGERPALVEETTSLTYRQLDERVTALAHRVDAARSRSGHPGRGA
ncbi:AMP-binding protein, partial [Streptomyces roseochromogenus]|uniref:AMP-binding protein n=1 Tax=Streptomyces roseochromogenus TaxID=285450 RepID=UPI0005602C9D